jgi:hypothetical protein
MSALLEALGYIGSSLDKPGAAVRGLLAGQPEQLLNLVPFSDAMGLTDETQRVSGSDLLGRMGWTDPGLGRDLTGLLVDTITNPLTYVGGTAVGKALPKLIGGASAEEAAAARLSNMLNARRGFAMVKDINPVTNKAAKIVGGDPEQGIKAARYLLGEAQRNPLTQGIYVGAYDAGGVLRGAIPEVGRHEVIHGLIDQAAKTGSMSDLPLGMRIPAQLRASASGQKTGIMRGLADLTDELAAQTLMYRTPQGQLEGALNFLVARPDNALVRAGYANALDARSPLVGALYRGMGYAPHAALAGGTAAFAGNELLNYLNGE